MTEFASKVPNTIMDIDHTKTELGITVELMKLEKLGVVKRESRGWVVLDFERYREWFQPRHI